MDIEVVFVDDQSSVGAFTGFSILELANKLEQDTKHG